MNKLSRRSLMTGAAALGAFAAGLPGQTVPAQAYMAKTIDKPVTISFYNYNLASAGVGADATKKLIADFMTANPNIKVEGVAVDSAKSVLPKHCSRTYSLTTEGHSPMTLALADKRVHCIPGLSNFRDSGGYLTRSGQVVKCGRLFRSAHPGRLTDEGLRELSAFGIRTIIDLRGVHECAELPMPSHAGTGMTRVPIHVEP